MKAYRYTSASGAGAIALAQTATPEPAPGEVRLRMAAASLNARDLLTLAAAGRGEVKDRIPPLWLRAARSSKSAFSQAPIPRPTCGG